MNTLVRLVALLTLLAISGCHGVETDRIPPVPVYLPFNSAGEWAVYGTPGATSWRLFVKEERVPAEYSFSAVSMTGYGGVLLCGDVFGAPVAYDAACPVECRRDVRVDIDSETLTARCPVCGSEFDVFSNYGYPLSGKAASLGYGLKRYYVGAGRSGEYMVVTQL